MLITGLNDQDLKYNFNHLEKEKKKKVLGNYFYINSNIKA